MGYFSGNSSQNKSSVSQSNFRQGVARPGNMQFTVDPHQSRKSRLQAKKEELLRKKRLQAKKEELLNKRSARQSNSYYTQSKLSQKPSKKVSKIQASLLKWSYRAGWCLWCILFVRLFVMDQGVWDYYQMDQLIETKKREVIQVHEENKQLKVEIERMKLDPKYQKKLAREHLNVIAVDEYLVLFSREVGRNSR